MLSCSHELLLTSTLQVTRITESRDRERNKKKEHVNEMKVLREIVGKTNIDRTRSQQIRESCDIQPINEWMERRRREWDQHVTIMDADVLVKISRDNTSIPVGRTPGRPKRRRSDLIID